MTCPRCGRDNPPENEFCGRCGLEFAQVAVSSEPAEDAQFCYKHKKELTHLRCGRCDRPICAKCVIIGPAGPRCKDCAKHNIAVRPGAVVHEVATPFKNLLRMGPSGIWILLICASLLFGLIRSCSSAFSQPHPRYEAPAEPPQ